MNPEDLSVKAERSQDSAEQLSPVWEDSASATQFKSGMEAERHDGLSNGNRLPDQNFSAGVDAYYHHPPLQQHGSQETTQYHTAPQMHTDSAYSPQSSFEAPSEQASYVAPPQPPPTARKQSQRQRSGNLSMLRVPPKIADKYVNLLVVGESGLGKTTFIRNCFADLLNEDFELLDASWGSMTEFKDSPSVFCTHLPAIEVPEALIRLRYSVQDVPGYGDDMAYENSDSYVSEILALVRQQNIHQCNETQGILLEELEFKHMYDACIYFVSPHQLKPRDLKFMASISKVVPVIPVIAKADCMTIEERQSFRNHINASLEKPSYSSAEGASEAIEVFKFPEEVMEAAEAAGNPLPFAVVGSRDTDDVEGDDMPLRHYPWGTCLPLRKEHSDAVFFRKTVLEYGFHALREEKKARYIAFRDSLLQADKQQEQSQQQKQEKLQQQQQQMQARQAEEDAYYAQQQTELASSGRKNSSKSSSVSQQSSIPDYSQGLVPPTPSKKPYEEYNSKKNTNFFGLKKKDLSY